MKRKMILTKLKKKVPASLRTNIRNLMNRKDYGNVLAKFENNSSSNKLILMATPEHGNIGDHAIAFAQHSFLEKYFSNNFIVEITGDCYRSNKSKLKKQIRKNDTIVISGGGFLGNLWLNEEELVRDIIKNFPDNLVVVFPQTIYFEDNESGSKEFMKSKNIFSKHKNLIVAVRDKSSIEVASKLIGCDRKENIVFVPDIVTCLPHQEIEETGVREGLLVCLRKDKEKVVDNEINNEIKKVAKDLNLDLEYTDTVVNSSISIEMREKFLKSKLYEFSSSQLVITDRLHGMLFAAITGTPCIALNNSSGKVAGVYEWIDYLDYIKLVKSIDDITGFATSLLEVTNCKYESSPLENTFEDFANKILGAQKSL